MKGLLHRTALETLVSLCFGFSFLFLGSSGTDLSQFQLPPCCYGDGPIYHQGAASTEFASRKLPIPPPEKLPENVTTENGQIRKYTFPMESFDVSETGSDVEKIITKRTPESDPVPVTADPSTTNSTDNTSRIDLEAVTGVPEPESTENSRKSNRMPRNWELHLRRALYQSMNSTELQGGGSKGGSDLWESIRDAPLEVIDPSTRTAALKRVPELELSADRISGVMVNSKDGVELRTAASNYIGQTHPQCDCPLIQHGDALLAYWSVGPSDSGMEYLVYPVQHNIPTPPIFLSFHTDKHLIPSPVDLNPGVSSDQITREIPFQASLEFGIHSNQGPGHYEHQSLHDGRLGFPAHKNLHNHPPHLISVYQEKRVEHFGYPGGKGHFPERHPQQVQDLAFVRNYRKLGYVPLIDAIPLQDKPLIQALPQLFHHPNSIQQILTEHGLPPPQLPPPPPPQLPPPQFPPQPLPPTGPGYRPVLPPSGGPSFGPFPGNPDFGRPLPGTPDFGRPLPGNPDFGRPLPGSPDFGRPLPGGPDYRPLPGNPDFGRPPPVDPNYRPNPGGPDYRPLPGDPNYRPLPENPDYRPLPGDPNYRPLPENPDYRPLPGDPDYGRYPPGREPDYPISRPYPSGPDYRPSNPKDPNYGRPYPSGPGNRPRDPNYRPLPERDPNNNYGPPYPTGPDYRPLPPRDRDPNYGRPYPSGPDDNRGGSYNPQQECYDSVERRYYPCTNKYYDNKGKRGNGLGVGVGKVRYPDSDYKKPLSSASVLRKREQKLSVASGTEASYNLKF